MTSAAPCKSRSDPLLLCVLALLLGAVPAAAFAEDSPPPASTSAAIIPSQPPVATDVAAAAQPPAEPPAAAPPEGFFPEPRFIRRAIRFATRTIGDDGHSNNGLYPELSNMVTGAGWISAGPGYRQWLMNDHAVVDASAGVSWRLYKMAQARIEFTDIAHSRVAIGSQLLWQDLTQVTFFGEGADALEENRSEYRMKSTDLVGYATFRPIKWLSIGGKIGWLQRPTLLAPAGTFTRGNPETQTVFPDDPVFAFAEQPSYVHVDASVTADTRDSRSHPYSGGVYRTALTSYSDRASDTFSFLRYEAEAAQFVPLAGKRVVLATHGWLVASNTSADHTIPFYLMPSLGGANTLRGFTDFRFHDRNLLVVNAESRFALLTHMDLAAFVDAGSVAPRVSQLNVDKISYGVGIRMHSGHATFARVDVAHGAEGWRFLFRMNDPLHLSRLSRRTAAAPFVP
jgi:hypothetical protein